MAAAVVLSGLLLAPTGALAAAPGSISGTVTDGNGTPLQNVCVNADATDPSGTPGGAQTDASGHYSVTGLDAGSYKVEFTAVSCSAGNYASQWYQSKLDYASADPVTVTAGQTTSGINAALQPGGIISGHVTDSHGSAVSNVCVTAQASGFDFTQGAVPNASGDYTITGLPSGSYTLEFSSCLPGFGHWVTQFYNNKPDADSADSVAVTAGQTTSGIGAQLHELGQISGHVTDGQTNPLKGICVRADSQNAHPDSVLTDASGNYTIEGLPADSYTVEFLAACTPQANQGNYAPQWYSSRSSQGAADAIAVTLDHTSSGVDAAMAAGGIISGHVTNAQNAPLAGICVDANSGASTTTDASGDYQLTRLSSASYAVQFLDCSGGDYVRQWYQGRSNPDAADPVAVTAGQTTSAINAALQLGGAISGHVTDAGGNPVQGICISAWTHDPGNAPLDSGIQTDANGNYVAHALAPGSYKVAFDPCSSGQPFATQWYSAMPNFTSANPVTITSGQTASGINAALSANHIPACSDLSRTLAQDTSAGLTLSCTDADGNSLTYAIVASPAHGTASTPDSAGHVTYTPSGGYSGPDSFTYRASDGSAQSNVATVSLTITPSSGGGVSASSGGSPSDSPPATTSPLSPPPLLLPDMTAQIDRALGALLRPVGPRPTVRGLLRTGAYTEHFSAPAAGTATVRWIYPAGASAEAARTRSVIVAAGTRSYPSAGAGAIRIRLTTAGRQLLRRKRAVRIQSKATFRPAESGGQRTRQASWTLR